MAPPPRFSLDSSLGRLARWLRLLGHDAAWRAGDDLGAALARARLEDRVLLTRSKGIARLGLQWPPAGGMSLGSERAGDQLVEVARTHPIFETARPFTRCPDCNEPLREADRASAIARVPEFVVRTQTRFEACPSCGKLYWRATHSVSIIETLRSSAKRAGRRLSLDFAPGNDDAGSETTDPASKG